MSKVIQILKSIDAVMTDDHFVYTSGKHGEVYINKDALYPHTQMTSEVGKLFAAQAKDMPVHLDLDQTGAGIDPTPLLPALDPTGRTLP